MATYWVIKAPGDFFLAIRNFGGTSSFFWKEDDRETFIRFYSEEQADQVMEAVRALNPELFQFARVLKDAQAVEYDFGPE